MMRIKQNLIALLVCVFMLLISTTQLAAKSVKLDTPIEQYIQMADNDDALQVAVVRFKPRTGDRNWYVDLVSAVHVADQSYYDELNKRFSGYDAVLYELVAPEGTKVIPAKNQSEAQSRPKSVLTSLQTTMTDVLGLTFQMEGVDYSPNHFIHADFSPDEFKKSMENKGESIAGMVLQMWRAGLARELTAGAGSQLSLFAILMADDKQQALKRVMAEELAGAESMMTAFEGPEGSTLVAARNQKALSVLKRTLIDKKPQSVAIFYGAAHMQDFQQRLINDFDLVPVSVEWLDAWNLE
ncbi:MAG: hypothetical protein OQK49_01860 [Proteobacteria bacterium]|nr:hypothetical protein [Pseudomonadota bacterium]